MFSKLWQYIAGGAAVVAAFLYAILKIKSAKLESVKKDNESLKNANEANQEALKQNEEANQIMQDVASLSDDDVQREFLQYDRSSNKGSD